MKIGIINNLYTPFNRGGAEEITKILNEELTKEEHQTKIISTKPWQKSINKNKDIIYINSLFYNLDKIPVFLRFFWHIWDTFNIKNYFKIISILKKEKFDLIISNNLKGIGLLTPLAIKKTNTQHIHILHDIQLIHPSGLMIFGEEGKIDTFFSKKYQKITAKLFGNINKVISPSKWLLKIHQDKGLFLNTKNKVIENPISFKKTKAKNYLPNKDDFKFLYVGQIEDHKGIFFLIDTFKKYAKNKNVKLKIIGDGSSKNKLKLDKNIEYLGKKNKNEVIEEMKNIDCLIVPSLCYENSPTVIYEALSVNTKIIASDIGGISDIINNTKCNFLFKPCDEGDLVLKMDLVRDEECIIDNSSCLEELTSLRYVKELLKNY